MTMRFFTALVLLMSFEGTVIADSMCPMSKLLEFTTKPYYTQCSLDSGTRQLPIMSHLSLDEIKVYCDSAACMEYWNEFKGAKLGECILPGRKVRLQADILDAFDTKCSAIRSMSSSSNVTGKNIRDESSSSGTSSAVTIAVSWIATITLTALTMFN